MKRLLCVLAAVAIGTAQTPPAAPPTGAEEQKPAAAEAEKAAPAESAAPVAEEPTEGTVEFGYRGVAGLRGSVDAYRSIVNLGEGPKLFHIDFMSHRLKGKAWDRLSLRADSWGGEPYNTASFSLSRERWYRLSTSYRNLAQFNRLPSFALGLPSLDTRRRDGELEFELLPNRSVTPYFGWTASSGTGAGITHYVASGNEYAVAGALEDRMQLFRGGVRVTQKKWYVSGEQGGLRYRQEDFWGESRTNPGNVRLPIFGQPLNLSSLTQGYRIKGNGGYSKAVAGASPARWLDVSASFLYSQPQSEVDYSERAGGQFALLNPLRFTTSITGTATGITKMPHTSGWVSAEVRPHDRVRVVESWLTDRLNNDVDPLKWNYSRQQLEGFVDVTSFLTLQGGHRYEWGDSTARLPQLSGPPSAELKRHVGLAGLRARWRSAFQLNANYERGSSDSVYFRTSANDYHRLRGQVRIQPTSSLAFQGNWTVLDNSNPSALGRWDWLSRTQSATATWTTKQGALWAGYTRATVRSEIPYLIPQELRRASSVYREDSHTVTALWECGAKQVKFGAGGSAFVSAGTRQTRLWEPVWRVTVPVRKHLAARAEWRYHGFSQPLFAYDVAGPSSGNPPPVGASGGFYPYEAFRAHVWTVSLVGSVK